MLITMLYLRDAKAKIYCCKQTEFIQSGDKIMQYCDT